jgi:predicted PurR-regulated permease PerM
LLDTPLIARAARVGIVAWTLIALLLLGYWAYHYVVLPVQVVFPPLIVATIIVYLLNPLVSRFERKGVSRGWGTLFTYVVFFVIAYFVVKFLSPIVSRQVAAFVATVPDLVVRAGDDAQKLAERLNMSISFEDLTAELQVRQGLSFFGRIASITGGVIHAAVILILGPILAFYLLVDLPKLKRGVMAAIPARRRDETQLVAHKLAVSVGGFFRGQLLVATFVGFASALALWMVGLPYFALIGLICGIFNLVPLIGPYIAAIPAVFIALTTPVAGNGLFDIEPGWPLAIASAVALIIVQQIDNHIISPNVVARTVKLHPVTVMLSLLVGGTLLGLWGMLFAVPVVASAKILILHWWDTRAHWPPDEPEMSEGDLPDEPPPVPPRRRVRMPSFARMGRRSPPTA